MKRWPLFRTVPRSEHLANFSTYAALALVIGIGFPLIAWPISLMGIDVFPESATLGNTGKVVLFIAVAPIACVMGLALAIPFTWLALRLGIAGWLTAALAGPVISSLVFFYGFQITSPPAKFVIALNATTFVLGIAYWYTLYRLLPGAFYDQP